MRPSSNGMFVVERFWADCKCSEERAMQGVQQRVRVKRESGAPVVRPDGGRLLVADEQALPWDGAAASHRGDGSMACELVARPVPTSGVADGAGAERKKGARSGARKKVASAEIAAPVSAGEADGKQDRRDARDFFPPNPGRPAERPSPVNTALELLGSGHSDLSAVRVLRECHNLSLEQAQAAVESAYQKVASSQERPLGLKMALAVEQRSRIVAAAMEQSDYRIALSALEQRDKLLGLTGPETLQTGQAASTLLQLLQQAAGGENLTGGSAVQNSGGAED